MFADARIDGRQRIVQQINIRFFVHCSVNINKTIKIPTTNEDYISYPYFFSTLLDLFSLSVRHLERSLFLPPSFYRHTEVVQNQLLTHTLV